jgi:hypothetical protein
VEVPGTDKHSSLEKHLNNLVPKGDLPVLSVLRLYF